MFSHHGTIGRASNHHVQNDSLATCGDEDVAAFAVLRGVVDPGLQPERCVVVKTGQPSRKHFRDFVMATYSQTGTAFVPTIQRVERFFGELMWLLVRRVAIFVDRPWARQVYIADNGAAMAHYVVWHRQHEWDT